MLNRIYAVDSVTLTTSGSAVSSYMPFDMSTRKLLTQVVLRATGNGAYVRLSDDKSAATSVDMLVQAGDHAVVSVQGRHWVSVLNVSGSSTVSIEALSTGVSGSASTLDLQFAGATALDSRITFSRASSASYYDATGTLRTAANDVPRLDYDPSTLQPQGLLIEEARTNLLTYSSEFDNSAWGKSAVSVTANIIVAPDGTYAADKLVESTANSYHTLIKNIITTAASYAWSCYIKAAERTFAFLYHVETNSAVSINLLTGATGTPSGTNAPTTVSVTSIGSGWYRLSMTATATAATNSFRIYVTTSLTGAGTYTGDGTSGIYIWGAQLEAGAFATSYIPTTTAAATRAQDNAAINTITPWYNATQGTLVASGIPYAPASYGSNQITVSIDNGTLNERIQIARTATSGTAAGAVVVGGLAIFNGSISLWSTNGGGKIALAYASANNAVAFGSAIDTTVSAAGVPTVTTLRIGARADTLLPWSGAISSITYYPRRLSDVALQAITS